jgi:hypothetical protein
MAIAVASGKTGFDGNFSPIIYSKQAQIALRKAAVATAITNNSYFGEIANQGDVVRIQKEPDVTVNSLERKTAITVQDLDDSDFQLTIDKANYFAFKMDDIEDQFASVDFVSLAADRAAYLFYFLKSLFERMRDYIFLLNYLNIHQKVFFLYF